MDFLLRGLATNIPVEFRRVLGFCGREKTANPKKNLGERIRTNNKLNPHMT